MKINLKEILTVFVLAALATTASWLIDWWSITCAKVTCIGINTFCHGFPLTFAINYQLSSRYTLSGIGSCADLPRHVNWSPLILILDYLFWFLLVFGSWQLAKFIRARIKNK